MSDTWICAVGAETTDVNDITLVTSPPGPWQKAHRYLLLEIVQEAFFWAEEDGYALELLEVLSNLQLYADPGRPFSARVGRRIFTIAPVNGKPAAAGPR